MWENYALVKGENPKGCENFNERRNETVDPGGVTESENETVDPWGRNSGKRKSDRGSLWGDGERGWEVWEGCAIHLRERHLLTQHHLPPDGVRPFHQKSTCITQLTLGPNLVT